MKHLKLNFLFALIASLVIIAGCKDENEEPESDFIGNFVIKKASVSESLNITTNELGAFQLPAGTDITPAIQTALLSQASCSSPDKSWIELRKDKTMYMSCEGTNAINAGTWEELSETQLKLNMNNTVIPSSPTGLTLTVTDIVKSASGLTGKTTVPLPKAMVEALITPLTLDASTPIAVPVSFSIEFSKK